MATKRHLESFTEAGGDDGFSPAPSIKRARNSNGPSQRKSNKQQSEAATDVTYGQRYCFSSVNEPMSDEDLEFEDETDALAYLQSVRHEASAIPHLLVAPKSGPQLPSPRAVYDNACRADDDDAPVDRSINNTDHEDARGYYKDGAYTAAPSASPPSPASSSDEINAAYFASLIAAFHRLRTTLHQTPPPTNLSSNHSSYVGTFGPRSRTFAIWSVRLRQTDPHPAQVAAMDKAGVLRLLRVLLGGKFLRSGGEVYERTSRWLWALLARLPDRGEMDHLEVGHVRELGKRAALLMHTLKEMAALREEVEIEGHNGDGDEAVWVGEGEDEYEEGEAREEHEVEEKQGKVRHRDDEVVTAEVEQGGVSIQAEISMDTTKHQTFDASHLTSAAPASASNADRKAAEGDDGMEDGEIADESEPMDIEDDFESAKARLLANLENASEVDNAAGESDTGDKAEKTPAVVPARSRMNMRATLTMILTVAGEFYGQRDLLEFRDPFHGI